MYNKVNACPKADLHTLSLVKPLNRTSGKKRLLRAGLRLLIVAASLFLLKQGYALFLIKEIQVNVPANFDTDDLLQQSGIRTGTSILFLNTDRAAQRLMDEPAVLNAEILKIFPSTLAVTIEGRAPSAYILGEGDFWIVDSEGIAYQRGSSLSGSLPVITGVASSLPVLGQPLKDPALAEALKAFISALAVVPDLNPSELNLSAVDNMVLYTAAGVKVMLGDSGKMARKLILVREALPYIGGKNDGIILDVRTGEQLVVVNKN